ncbi:hypothetical protein L208DRAFT_1454009 [Tricholoma matsutake]|nr:hypothetical protein L208DRAFT_1454009 [Tricholoma matsutake 945]
MTDRHNTHRPEVPEVPNFGGMDTKLLKSIISKIPANSETGRVGLPDIMRFVSQNPSELNDLMTDLSSHDFASLAPTIKHEFFWVLQLEHVGMVDASERPVDSSNPSFVIYCYDDQERYRITHDCVGLPNSSTVLQALHRAIVKPLPPLKPCLPWLLLLSIKFKQHLPFLKSFLDSLPSPFHWRFETQEEADNLNEGIFQMNQQGALKGFASAEEKKKIGNAAFARKDYSTASRAYSDAIEDLLDVLSQKPDLDSEKKAKKLLAICHANRAAAYLISGEGSDATKALGDGKAAEVNDPSYAKGYIRQATAYQVLGDLESAKDAVARALGRQELENDLGLADRLIDLYTDGKGFPDEEEHFKSWMLEVHHNHKKSSERLRYIGGEWTRRCDAQLAKWKQ